MEDEKQVRYRSTSISQFIQEEKTSNCQCDGGKYLAEFLSEPDQKHGTESSKDGDSGEDFIPDINSNDQLPSMMVKLDYDAGLKCTADGVGNAYSSLRVILQVKILPLSFFCQLKICFVTMKN